jgi:hypothetical protein
LAVLMVRFVGVAVDVRTATLFDCCGRRPSDARGVRGGFGVATRSDRPITIVAGGDRAPASDAVVRRPGRPRAPAVGPGSTRRALVTCRIKVGVVERVAAFGEGMSG